MSIQFDESIEDLQYEGYRIIQKKDKFRFGMDAVLLANFVSNTNGKTVVDIGTGTGIIPILIAAKTDVKKILAVEVQGQMVEMANRSIKLNNLEDRIEVLNEDINNFGKIEGLGTYNIVVTNPPYMKKGNGLLNETYDVSIARHELLCTFEDICYATNRILKDGGELYLIHRTDRLVDILSCMRNEGIEPKEMQFIHPNMSKPPNLVLVKGRKGGNPELKILPPLYVYDKDGNYTEEINRIYCRTEEL